MTTSPNPPIPFKGLWRRPWLWLACGGGAGCAPVAPGTVGTLAAVPLYLLLMGLPLPAYLLVVALLAAAGVWICHRAAAELGVHDHPGIVWDEIVGYLLTMAAAPAGWGWVVLGFLWFRLFDIVKPWPVRWADGRVGGGFGIMLDDLLAGVYAWLALAASQWLLLGLTPAAA